MRAPGVLLGTGIALCAFVAVAPAQTTSRPAAPRKAVAAPGAEFESLRTRAENAEAAGRLPEAVSLYAQAVRLQPTWTEGFWRLGTTAYDADQFRECRDAFAQVVRREPQHGAAWAFRGLCEFGLQAYAPSLEHLTKGREIGIGNDPAFQAVVGYHRAILLARSGQFERALEAYAGFVRGGNTGPEVTGALGITMLRLPILPSEVTPDQQAVVALAGRAGVLEIGMVKEEAERAFVELVTRFGDVRNVHFLYGAYLARERPDQGLEQFRIELAQFPNHVLARVHIALELIKRNDFAGAAPYALEAATLEPRNFLTRKVAGQVKLQTGDAKGAIVELEAARTLEPTSPSVRYQLARAYQRAGRAEDAKRERAEFSRLEAIQQKKRGGAAAREDETQ